MSTKLRPAILAVVVWCAASTVAAQKEDTNWSLKGGDFTDQHYSPLTQVNESNINDLGLAWASDLLAIRSASAPMQASAQPPMPPPMMISSYVKRT
jgi:glucose dehydrogenase